MLSTRESILNNSDAIYKISTEKLNDIDLDFFFQFFLVRILQQMALDILLLFFLEMF